MNEPQDLFTHNYMNSLNTNSQPIVGTKNGWGKIVLFAMVVLILGVMSKGCSDTNDQTPLFIISQHQ